MPTTITIGRPGQFAAFERECAQRLKRAALAATDRAARGAVTEIRSGMRSAGLGKLGNAVAAGSDVKKGHDVHNRGTGFSASGWIYVRGRSERTAGALDAYTVGATIIPRRGSWLAIRTDQIPARVGRQKMTPALYASSGLVDRIGPLKFVRGRNGNEALLIVQNVTVDAFGRRGKFARRLPKRGAVGITRQPVRYIVAFILIRSTSRSARFDPNAALSAAASRLPSLIAEELTHG